MLLLYSLALAIPIIYIFVGYYFKPAKLDTQKSTTESKETSEEVSESQKPATEEKPKKSIMQAENPDLAPPKDDPFTLEQLRDYDGSDSSKPIYVAIKGMYRYYG